MKSRVFPYILAGVIAAIIGTYLRFLPYTYKSPQMMREAAKSVVYQRIRNDLTEQIEKEFPNITPSEKERLTEMGLISVLKEKGAGIDDFVNKNLEKLSKAWFLGAKDEHLMAADSYYYLGLTKNILEKGSVSDSIKGGLYYNPLMMVPHGHRYYFDLHPYVGFFVYKIVRSFNDNISLEMGVAYTPILLTIVALAIFVMLTYKMGVAAIPAFVGSLFFLSTPIFFQRSLFGWYDTDPYNVIFPALIILCLFLAFSPKSKQIVRFSYLALASFLTGAYTMFWSGWVFIPVSVILFFIIILSYKIIRERSLGQAQMAARYLLVYVVMSMVCIATFRGFDGLVFSLQDTFTRISKFLKNGFSLWPDVFLTVGELKKVSFLKIVVLSGGRIFSLLSVAGLLTLFIKKGKDAATFHNGSILLSFIVVPLILSSRAERFTILLVTPLSILFTFSIDYIYKRSMRISGIVLRFIAVAGLLSLTFIPIKSGHQMALRGQPIIYNETWDKIMRGIRDDTPEDSIINTWWSPGHFITSMARRRVTFDGATLEQPVGYWISKMFLSPNEEYALGILRMLNVSGNDACSFLTNRGLKLSHAVRAIDHVVTKTKPEARRVIRKYLDEGDAEKFLSLTHGVPAPSYILVYNDLVEKTLALCFVGNWNFKRAEDFKNLKDRNPGLASDFIRNQAGGDYVRFLWGVSGGPVYYDKEQLESRREGDVAYFPNGLKVNLSTKEFGFVAEDNPLKGKIKSLIYLDGGDVKEKFYADDPSKLSIILVDRGIRHSVMPADRSLATSLLFRLYYLKGAGLKRLKLFMSETGDIDNTAIRVYKVEW